MIRTVSFVAFLPALFSSSCSPAHNSLDNSQPIITGKTSTQQPQESEQGWSFLNLHSQRILSFALSGRPLENLTH